MKKAVPICPMCDSSKTWKDGIRRTNDGDIQRYLYAENVVTGSVRQVGIAPMSLNMFKEFIESH